MTWQWIGLVCFSLTLLPAGLALVAGWIPPGLRHRLAPARPRGLALLALYSAVPLNAVPRLVEAPPAIVLAGTALAAVLAVAGCVYAALALGRARSVNP